MVDQFIRVNVHQRPFECTRGFVALFYCRNLNCKTLWVIPLVVIPLRDKFAVRLVKCEISEFTQRVVFFCLNVQFCNRDVYR